MLVRVTGTPTDQIQSLRTERALLPLMLSLFEETLPFCCFFPLCVFLVFFDARKFRRGKAKQPEAVAVSSDEALSFLGPDETRRTWHLFPRS